MIDHLVYGVPDLEQAIRNLKSILGFVPQIGGQHPGKGTWNALFSLGEGTYFELIAADPKQAAPQVNRWMGIDYLERPQLLRWAWKSTNLVTDTAKLAKLGYQSGKIETGRRQLSDGSQLRWQLTDPGSHPGVEVIPFLLHWGDSVHPSQGLEPVCSLLDLKVAHPEPSRIQMLYDALGIPIRVVQGMDPSLTAIISSPNGRIEF